MQPIDEREAGDPAEASTLSRQHGHAFKNIFSIIIANAEMISEEGGGEGLIHRRLERIIAASHRGEQLVETIRHQDMASISTPAPLPIASNTETGPLHGRVLVVDDEADVVEIIRRYLLKVGLEIIGLTDSLEALNRLTADPFAYDLVLTDLDMPHCSGAELCSKLHPLRPELPMIVMTGYGRSITLEEVSHAGVQALLCKPLDRRQLIATIRRLLSA